VYVLDRVLREVQFGSVRFGSEGNSVGGNSNASVARRFDWPTVYVLDRVLQPVMLVRITEHDDLFVFCDCCHTFDNRSTALLALCCVLTSRSRTLYPCALMHVIPGFRRGCERRLRTIRPRCIALCSSLAFSTLWSSWRGGCFHQRSPKPKHSNHTALLICAS